MTLAVIHPSRPRRFNGELKDGPPRPGLSVLPGLRTVIEFTVVSVFGVAHADLALQRRGRANVALARQVAMYLAHVGFSMSLTEVGELFDRDRTTVAHACMVIEDRRDDPDFDRVMELLERAARALHRPPFSCHAA